MVPHFSTFSQRSAPGKSEKAWLIEDTVLRRFKGAPRRAFFFVRGRNLSSKNGLGGTSGRSGDYGSYDLYASQASGSPPYTFNNALNTGSSLNTAYMEAHPFITGDNLSIILRV